MKTYKEIAESCGLTVTSQLVESNLAFSKVDDESVKWGSEIDYAPALDRIAANNYYLNREGKVVKLVKDDTGTFDSKKGTTFTKGGWTHGKGQYKKTDLVYKIGKESDYKKFKAK